jgi:CRP-like cAMP-binding protein
MDSKQILDFMLGSKLFSGFSIGECITLEKILNPFERSFSKNEIVYDEDEEIKSVGQILKGQMIGEKFNFDGQAHIVHTFDKLDVIGLETIYSSKKGSPITYIAETDVVMLMFPFSTAKNREQIPPALQIKIRDNIMRILADENIKSLYKLEVLSKRALRCRVRTFLCIMEKKTGKRTFHIGMDREQLAQYLCVNRSALSYELSQMQKEGLIAFEKDLFTLLRI